MESRQGVLVSFLVLLLFLHHVIAEFGFQRPFPKDDKDLEKTDYKCIPGRTMIKVSKRVETKNEKVTSSEETDGRRSHMNFQAAKDETCSICVCSVEGKDEYCSKRPTENVNECIRMAQILKDFQANAPFDHEKILSYMIRRRDYIWHNGEIPYPSKAKCYRAHSYYSNSPFANDADVAKNNIDVGSDVSSILDYDNKTICFYCVCSVSGVDVGCIHRDPYYCEYFRIIRQKNSIRDRYRILFKQDRPQYFSHISWRLRRKMDEGIFELISTGGDSLCCNHPSGHRRSLHNRVSKIFHNLRRKVPKENLMSGSPGGDYVDFIVNNDK